MSNAKFKVTVTPDGEAEVGPKGNTQVVRVMLGTSWLTWERGLQVFVLLLCFICVTE